ncbi:MAG: tetratricopeptide repeat protein [bacterium]|nr:tetratricopeptide repeat protein [bacterium]
MTIEISSIGELQKAINETADDQVLLLDFWSPRCGPCKVLTPILEELVKKYAPQVRLAKINVDDPRLQPVAIQLRVQSVPTVKFVVGGQIVHEFVGALPASVVEGYLKEVLPEPREQVDAMSAARAALAAGQWQRALKLYEMVVAKDKENTEAQLGCVRCHLFLGNASAAREALARVRNHAREDEKARLELVAEVLARRKEYGGAAKQAARVTSSPGDYHAVYDWACSLIGEGEYEQACEALLRIIEHDKTFLDGQPKRLLLGLFDLLGAERPQVQEYRKRLASALFI